ncbi:MAG TPA: hypothetical protein VHW73_06515 [Rudaea sp.]|jgi:hypothetical protein|nr:hypothetical protein [Rudaea sp.]
MNRNSLTTAVIAGIAGVAGIANMASAVNLNPDGLGQVLLYPYYTVNGGQQTLLSVVNTAAVGKAVKVRFLEGYNSREVLDFNLFLSPFDVWTADVFALSDLSSGLGTGAGITTSDNSCTAPVLKESTSGVTNYVAFRTFTFSGTNSDTGPTDASRTREGHFEMISMADIVTDSDLSVDTTHVNGVPPGCGTFANGAETPAERDFEAGEAFVAPTSGLFGSAEVVNTSNGTYYSYNADALDGFTAVALATPTSSLTPSLGQVNPPTSYVFDDGILVTSSWTTTSEAIDAVSSVFMASNVYNEYAASAAGNGTDWVLTFPTKRFYVDSSITLTSSPILPFEEEFGANEDGLSCTVVGIVNYDREENTLAATGCGFSPCPPGQPPSSICHETNVITFNANSTTNSVLSSTLTSNIVPIGSAGWAALNLNPNPGVSPDDIFNVVGGPHNLRLATNGNEFHGLPVTGFQATNFVVGGSTSILANYSSVNRHRISRSCTNAGGGCS